MIVFLLFILLCLLLLSFGWRLKTGDEPHSEFDDILHSWLALVNDHGILQVEDKLLVERGLVLKLMVRPGQRMKNRLLSNSHIPSPLSTLTHQRWFLYMLLLIHMCLPLPQIFYKSSIQYHVLFITFDAFVKSVFNHILSD